MTYYQGVEFLPPILTLTICSRKHWKLFRFYEIMHILSLYLLYYLLNLFCLVFQKCNIPQKSSGHEVSS